MLTEYSFEQKAEKIILLQKLSHTIAKHNLYKKVMDGFYNQADDDGKLPARQFFSNASL